MIEKMTYTYLNPKVALMGPGCVKEIGRHAKDLGATKSLIVSGKSRHGKELAQDIYKILEKAGMEAVIFRRQTRTRPILQLWKEQTSTGKKTAT